MRLCQKNPVRFSILFEVFSFWPSSGSAHSLNILVFSVGPMPLIMAAQAWPLAFLIPLTIALYTWVLRMWAPHLGLLGNLWRAAGLYFIARIAEGGVLLCAPGLISAPGLDGFFMALIAFLSGVLLVLLVAGRLLYRRTGLPPGRSTMAVCSAVLAGYLVSLAIAALMAFG